MLLRIEFNKYEDNDFYFLYVTNEVRIETDCVSQIKIEDNHYKVRTVQNPLKYLTIEQSKDEYFNESLVIPNIDTVIEAVKVLYNYLEK